MAINTEAYEEMIGTLQRFLSDASEQCEAMQGAASDLSDNMDGDEHAANKAGQLSSAVSAISNALEGVNPIIQGLQQELEAAQAAGSAG